VPTLLVETHALKPYEQRVLGTYVLLESALRTLGETGPVLRRATRTDRARRPAVVPLAWQAPKSSTPEMIDVLGIDSRREPSAISGAPRVVWTGTPRTLRVPLRRETEPKSTATRPRAYWIPAVYTDVAERLALHGVEMERTSAPRELEVEMMRIGRATFDSVPFEGRVRVVPTTVTREPQRRLFAAGSFRVPTDQPAGDLAVLLLEPEAPDSFFQWGFFHSALQRTEYAEPYILEAMAERMLAADAGLRGEWERALRVAEFAADPAARLRWFYVRTPFYDADARLYPVGRELR
jgi:hypothetical protein